MTNLTTEEIAELKRIVEGATKENQSYGFLPDFNMHLGQSHDVPPNIRNISDLSTIIAQHGEIERLRNPWISDEFPKSDEECIFVHKGRSYTGFWDSDIGAFGCSELGWCSEFTCWMPIPQPPRESDDE